MCCGGLLAADSFPDGDFMISGGGGLEGVTIHDMQFDLNRRGSGALHFDNTLRVHLDRLFIHHYVQYGIQAVQGHEVHVSNCWLGEWAWAESGGRASQNLTGVAIEIDGQDVSVSFPSSVAVSLSSHVSPSALALGHHHLLGQAGDRAEGRRARPHEHSHLQRE